MSSFHAIKYFSDHIEYDERAACAACMVRNNNLYTILVLKPNRTEETFRKKVLEMTDSSKTALTEIGWNGVDWNYLAWDKKKWWALVNTASNPRGV
jgi:hypothetical protein